METCKEIIDSIIKDHCFICKKWDVEIFPVIYKGQEKLCCFSCCLKSYERNILEFK